jgi:hypothetical protein
MIVQLHHQRRDDLNKTEMVAQSQDFDEDDFDVGRKFLEWLSGAQERHPLPEGMQFLVCSEDAPMFVRAAPQESE